jgi:hypothetical protein
MKRFSRFISHGPRHLVEVGVNSILWIFLRFQVWSIFNTRFSRHYKKETVRIALNLNPITLIELGAGLSEISGEILRVGSRHTRVIATDMNCKVLIGAKIKNWRFGRLNLETQQLDFLSKPSLLKLLYPFKTGLVIIAVNAVTPDSLTLLLGYLQELRIEGHLIVDLRSEYAIQNHLCNWLPSESDITSFNYVIHESRDTQRSICVIALN